MEASVCSKSSKSLLLSNQGFQFCFVRLQYLLKSLHLLRFLLYARSLKSCLLVNLTYFHEDHTCRVQIKFLVNQQTKQVLEEECFVISSVEQTNCLSAHVSLLFNQFLQVQLKSKVAIVLCVNHEHWLYKEHMLGIVHVNCLDHCFTHVQFLLFFNLA